MVEIRPDSPTGGVGLFAEKDGGGKAPLKGELSSQMTEGLSRRQGDRFCGTVTREASLPLKCDIRRICPVGGSLWRELTFSNKPLPLKFLNKPYNFAIIVDTAFEFC